MNRRWCVVLLVVLAAPALLSAKGLTTKVVMTGPHLTTPIEITDPDLLRSFTVWAGPGTGVNGVEQLDGFVADWRSGAVTERPAGLQRYEASFYVKYVNRPLEGQQDQLAYVIYYESAGSGGQGYVYLPGKADAWYRLNTRAIYRGREGQWFRATNEWDRVVKPLVAQAGRR